MLLRSDLRFGIEPVGVADFATVYRCFFAKAQDRRLGWTIQPLAQECARKLASILAISGKRVRRALSHASTDRSLGVYAPAIVRPADLVSVQIAVNSRETAVETEFQYAALPGMTPRTPPRG
jgi:hypothetical protein